MSTGMMTDAGAASVEELRAVRAALLRLDRDAELNDALHRVEELLIEALRQAREARGAINDPCTGWPDGPPEWEGRPPDLECDVCGYRYWRFAGLVPGSRCPWPSAPAVRCSGHMVPVVAPAPGADEGVER